MDRRGFISKLALAIPALALDPERLLWTPDQRTIFIPDVIDPRTGTEIAALYRAEGYGGREITGYWVDEFEVTQDHFMDVLRYQRALNIHQSMLAESISLAPKAPWVNA